MDKFKDYTISFAGLSLGKHAYSFDLDQKFFDLFTFTQEFESLEMKVELSLEKKTTMLILDLKGSGVASVQCDVSGELYDQPLDSTVELLVKFGESFDLSDDEVWVIPRGEYQLDISQLLFEMALLSLPTKKIHPSIVSGENQEVFDLLEKYAPKVNEEENQSTDPRWDSLKKLKK